MVHLVHITSENLAKRIGRNGIAPTRLGRVLGGVAEHDRAVWTFPVLASRSPTPGRAS
jgi:hypothetical protein